MSHVNPKTPKIIIAATPNNKMGVRYLPITSIILFFVPIIENINKQKIEENKEAIGYTAKIKIVKNKVAPPFKKLELPVMFNRGYDLETDLIEAAMQFGIVTRAGAFYTLGDQKVQGRDKLRTYLLENDEIRGNLAHEVQTRVSNIRMGKEAVPEIIEE